MAKMIVFLTQMIDSLLLSLKCNTTEHISKPINNKRLVTMQFFYV